MNYTPPQRAEYLFSGLGPDGLARVGTAVWDALSSASGGAPVPHTTFLDRGMSFVAQSSAGLRARFSVLRQDDDTIALGLEMMPPRPDRLIPYLAYHDTIGAWQPFLDIFKVILTDVYRRHGGIPHIPPPPDRANPQAIIDWIDLYYPNEPDEIPAGVLGVTPGTLRNWRWKYGRQKIDQLQKLDRVVSNARGRRRKRLDDKTDDKT